MTVTFTEVSMSSVADPFTVRIRAVNGLVHAYSHTWGALCRLEWAGRQAAPGTVVTCLRCAVRWRR